jgi:hypothetical protein
MNHLTDGQIRASLDDELGNEGSQHLETCQDCQARLATLKAARQRTEQRLAFLAKKAEENATDLAPVMVSHSALVRFKQRLESNPKEKIMLRKIFSSRSLWVGLATLALVAVLLSVPSIRAWAGEFLGLFRVQQVAVIPIDTTGMSQLSGDSALGKQIGQLLANSVSVNQKPGEPKAAVSAAEAGQIAGFIVRLPDNQTVAPQLFVESGSSFEFTIDRAKAQALLDEAGRKDLVLPQALDGAKIKLEIPAGVSASYGSCPTPSASEDGLGIHQGSPGRRYSDCVIFAQIPSPVVTTPPNVDFKQLAELGLEFTGMTPDQAKAFSDSVDWTSSLVIPIPKNAATYQQVQVDGVTGTLIQRPADDAPQYVLIWVKNGIIYAISSLGSNSAQAVQMANSLK